MEQEFWRILSLPDASIKVEYGADLPTGELGSGFPSSKTKDITENDKVKRNKKKKISHFTKMSFFLEISQFSMESQ